MTYAQAQAYLYALKTQTASYGIERMQRFAEALGFRADALPCIHVAGTNGKGSVCAMLENVYRKHGYKTGLYTSPHLVYLGERIQVNRTPITPEQLAARIPRLKNIAEGIAIREPHMKPSFFEFMTALAFEHFMEEQVDIAIIETGLGGRLDATNIVQPLLSIITSIGLDHTEILGDTYAKIAAEKAGIIKTKTPVVIGHLPAEAESVVRQVALEKSAPLSAVRDAFVSRDAYPRTRLKGSYQQVNAATAVCAVNAVQARFPVDETLLQAALMDVVWEGRWQEFSINDGKRILLDATHNPEGAEYLEENLREWVDTYGKPIILTGTTGDARARALMPVVARYARAIYLLMPQQARAVGFSVLEAAIPSNYSGEVIRAELNTLFPAPKTCILGEPHAHLLVTGSIYLIGEVMERIVPGAAQGGSRLQDG